MTRLVAIASKQVQLQELVACINHFEVEAVSLHLFDHQGRISLEGARTTIQEACRKVTVDVSSFNIGERRAITRILDQAADVFAFSLYRASALYRRVPSLRRRGATIVHITDGVGDLFSMWELQRAVIAKTTLALAKAALVIPQLHVLRADMEFNLFHPKTSAYARQSLPVGPFPIASAKRQSLDGLLKAKRPSALVIDGFDLTAERIAIELGIASYVATRRDGGIEIDGRLHLEDNIICAEEVLALTRPAFVVGCPSTSLAAARYMHADLTTLCITTPAALRIRGPRFNTVFRAYAERFGVIFARSTDVNAQFEDLRTLIPDNARDSACA